MKKLEKILIGQIKKVSNIFLLSFILILLLAFLAIITAKFKVNIERINLKAGEDIKNFYDYNLKVVIYIFEKIPIFKITINKQLLSKIKFKQKAVKMIEKEIDKQKIGKQEILVLKNLKMKITKLDLKIEIGTENAAITGILVGIIGAIYSMFIWKFIKNKEAQKMYIGPIYIDKNIINLRFQGIIEIKMIHIINTICIINKRKRVDKNERTSNRRTYDYSYE